MVILKVDKLLNNMVCLVLSVNLWSWSHAYMFTAVSHMIPLLDTHKRVLENLNEYILKEEMRLYFLTKNSIIFKKERDKTKATIDILDNLGNPINSFNILKRLTIDFYFIEKLINETTEFKVDKTVPYPTRVDLEGAAQGIKRLQRTYHLNVTDLANGIVHFRRCNHEHSRVLTTPMTMADCYELSLALYKNLDYKYGVAWMQQALRKYKAVHEQHVATEVHLLEHIILAYNELNDYKSVSSWNKKLKALKFKSSRYYKSALNNNLDDQNIEKLHKERETVMWEKAQEIKRTKWDKSRKLVKNLHLGKSSNPGKPVKPDNPDKRAKPKKPVHLKKVHKKKHKVSTRRLCRGEMDIPTEVSKRLRCSYLTRQHGALLLARFKLEQLHLEPDVLLLHDVISNQEIQHVKDIATPNLTSMLIQDEETGGPVPEQYKITKTTWLRDEESDVVARLSRRVSAITGLSMATAEPFNVINYGIGGHFGAHYDIYEKTYRSEGDSLATVIFYMSDVQGGATVFPKLRLTVFPAKGAALFWMNLLPTGQPDYFSKHAGCPVLLGSKWVLTKWIYEAGQEFLKPCSLRLPDRVLKAPPVSGLESMRTLHFEDLQPLKIKQ